MATDRAILKSMQAGQLNSPGSANNATAEIGRAHTRSRDFAKVGTENAATAVAETVMFVVKRPSATKAVSFLTGTAIVANATDYFKFTVSKRTGTGAAVPVANWNSHTSAQSGVTANVPASLVVVPNADATLAAEDILTYTITKTGAGQVVAIGTITWDGEEV